MFKIHFVAGDGHKLVVASVKIGVRQFIDSDVGQISLHIEPLDGLCAVIEEDLLDTTVEAVDVGCGLTITQSSPLRSKAS